MKNKLIQKRDELKQYGSYLATDVFREERKLLCRINTVLFFRYKIK